MSGRLGSPHDLSAQLPFSLKESAKPRLCYSLLTAEITKLSLDWHHSLYMQAAAAVQGSRLPARQGGSRNFTLFIGMVEAKTRHCVQEKP
jgi:hypothetical protein